MKYIVASQLELGMYDTKEPEEAVAAFLREHDLDVAVTVYIADFIGKFSKETHIKRHPSPVPTKPDSPKAKAAVR